MAQHDLKFLFCIIVEKSNGNRFRVSSNHFMLFLADLQQRRFQGRGKFQYLGNKQREYLSRIYKYW